MKLGIAITLSTAILLCSSVKLRAQTTRQIPGDGDSARSQECPMCCQGPAGTPGIPGLPGISGQFGPAGAKGDAGVKGQKGETGRIGVVGEKGAPGNRGPKGDSGMGLPGPGGPPGLVGLTGQDGVKGQKGEPGETICAHRVAFTVTRSSASDTSTSDDTRLPFQHFKTLLPGTSFDLASGEFTCNVAGTYVFMFSLRADSSHTLTAHLRKNNDWVVSGRSSDTGNYEQVSGSAVLVLQQGDSVYLTVWGKTWSHPVSNYNSFSGFLLYAE